MAKENKDAFYLVGRVAFRRSQANYKLWEVLDGHGQGPRGDGANIVYANIERGKEAREKAEQLNKKMEQQEKDQKQEDYRTGS